LTDASDALNNVVLKFNHNYATFLYNLISGYSHIYYSGIDPICENQKRQMLFSAMPISKVNPRFNVENLFIVDKLDLLYGSMHHQHDRSTKFKDLLYENVFNQLESLYGELYAVDVMDDVFEAIEFIATNIECLLFGATCTDDDTDGNIVFYLDVVNKGLLLYIT
jgi:hypothetical protein